MFHGRIGGISLAGHDTRGTDIRQGWYLVVPVVIEQLMLREEKI